MSTSVQYNGTNQAEFTRSAEFESVDIKAWMWGTIRNRGIRNIPEYNFYKNTWRYTYHYYYIEEFRTLHNSGAGGKFYKWIARRIALESIKTYL